MDVQNQKQSAQDNSVNGELQGCQLQGCLYAKTPEGMTVGVLTSPAEASSLTLLAAGVAGLAQRRARREQRK